MWKELEYLGNEWRRAALGERDHPKSVLGTAGVVLEGPDACTSSEFPLQLGCLKLLLVKSWKLGRLGGFSALSAWFSPALSLG